MTDTVLRMRTLTPRPANTASLVDCCRVVSGPPRSMRARWTPLRRWVPEAGGAYSRVARARTAGNIPDRGRVCSQVRPSPQVETSVQDSTLESFERAVL